MINWKTADIDLVGYQKQENVLLPIRHSCLISNDKVLQRETTAIG